MSYPLRSSEQRQEYRVGTDLPATISVGSQLTIQGRLKDLSLKSAFIIIKSSVYLQLHEEVGFAIMSSPNDVKPAIFGTARISRLVPGEGLAIYFTSMSDACEARLKSMTQ